MNSPSQNPLVVTSASEAVLINSMIFITRMVWHHPTTTGHQLVVKDRENNLVWEKYAIAGGSGLDYDIAIDGWCKGIKVTTLDSGKLYVYMRVF